jgi:hypothetical protein
VTETREHGTNSRFQSGCRCSDCIYANKFVLLQLEYHEPHIDETRQFCSVRPSKSRPFPARDLVLAIGQPNAVVLASMIGVTRYTVAAWLRRGVCFTPYEADRYAIRGGTHPALVWGERWYHDELV